jgi:hypothetical protein
LIAGVGIDTDDQVWRQTSEAFAGSRMARIIHPFATASKGKHRSQPMTDELVGERG